MVKRRLLALSSLPAAAGLLLWVLDLDLGWPGSLARAYALTFAAVLGLWLASRALRRLLWRVSRRLAVSYFLIGVVPLPLLAFLVLVAAYIGSGFFLGHVYRDAAASITSDLRFATHRHMQQILRGDIEPIEHSIPIEFAYYRDGKKLAGAAAAPAAWQDWWPADSLDTASSRIETLPFVAGKDGAPTLAATVREGDYGILAIFDGDLNRELSERSGIWVELFRADDPDNQRTTKITFANREYPLQPPHFDTARSDLAQFFHPGVDDPAFVDRPWLTWVEISEPFLELDTGAYAAKYLSATLTANLRALYFHLVSPTSEVNLFVYLAFFSVTFLLFDIAIVAAAMAMWIVFGLSRAVNRLSEATGKVRQGDFSARIEVHRRDQIGALQRDFNQMASNLEQLVAAAAQKEILEKEIAIARALQRSLLPDTLAAPPALRFATHFEPSTAIGGDYYDLLPMGDRLLAVVVADVSGHGLSAGLRMAMVKSALTLLCEQEHRPEEVLERLHRLLRDRLQSSENGRGFVTATLTLVDSASGELVVTNAGHPPTYLLRGGEVTEILLPSTPLGTLGSDYRQARFQLEPEDAVVWLSDGLIEATGAQRDDFGYDRVVSALTGLAPEPAAIRDRLLEAVARHTGGGPPEDDRTLLVMSYRPVGAGADQSSPTSPNSA